MCIRDRINIGLLNRIIIDDVLLDDQNGQEMLKVTRLSAKFDIMPFFKGKKMCIRDSLHIVQYSRLDKDKEPFH